MVRVIRTVGHDDTLSLVDHLDELRSRLIISAAVLGVVFGFCLWQNHALLHFINRPVFTQTKKQIAKGEGTTGEAVQAQKGLLRIAGDTQDALKLLAAPGSGLSAGARGQLQQLQRTLNKDVNALPRGDTGEKLTTLGIGEPFTTTIKVCLYFALLFSLPLIMFQLFAFMLPALSPSERRKVVPLLVAVPFLFAGGGLFGYYVVLPAAVRFFVNFNSSEFNVLVQASQFYGFAATILLAMGLVFQIPVLILGATQMGLVTPRQLRKNRRYAILACASIAAFLPGDAVTLLLETVPLYVLYEASILLAAFVGRGGGGRGEQEVGAEAPAEAATSSEPNPPDPTVQQIIDHVDTDLSD